jgi:hypothetical protein
MDQDREERIRARAYEIWEREGRQEGSHLAHWEQAENELRVEEGGERQPGANDAATPSTSGLSGGDQSSGSAPSAEPGAGGESADTSRGSTADAPSRAPRNKS